MRLSLELEALREELSSVERERHGAMLAAREARERLADMGVEQARLTAESQLRGSKEEEAMGSPRRCFIPPEVSWGDTEAVVAAALRHASSHPAGGVGGVGGGAGFFLYGARGINCFFFFFDLLLCFSMLFPNALLVN